MWKIMKQIRNLIMQPHEMKLKRIVTKKNDITQMKTKKIVAKVKMIN
jgi:hypothetical protein